MKTLKFEELPQAVATLLDKIEEVHLLLQNNNKESVPPDQWFNIEELCDYLPNHPAKQTVYGWVGQRAIPCRKKGKKLYFLKSEIDEWLKSDKMKTREEIFKSINNNTKNGGLL